MERVMGLFCPPYCCGAAVLHILELGFCLCHATEIALIVVNTHMLPNGSSSFLSLHSLSSTNTVDPFLLETLGPLTLASSPPSLLLPSLPCSLLLDSALEPWDSVPSFFPLSTSL